MADVATQTPDPSPPIASLTGSPPIAGMVGKNTLAELAKSKREEVAAESKAFADEDSTNAKYLGTMQKFLDQEGVELDNAPKPWDADKEHKKFESDPIQGIGSVGSIFAVLASAFTKAPATNAIQGMAGAINAIKEGNESAYNRAYESYKQNIKLAMDREKIIHQKYMDAASLMQSNMEAANIKVKHIATQYGDHQVSLLWDAGLVKEAYEAIGARAKAADQLHELGEKDLDRHIRLNAYDQLKKEVPKGATPEQAAQIAAENMNAWRTVNNVKEAHNTPEQELTARIIHENPNASATDLAAKFEENGIKVGRQTERDKIIQERVYFEEQAIRDREGRDPTAAESAKIREQAAAMGHSGGAGTGGAPKNGTQLKIAEMQEIKDEGAKDGKWQTLGDQEKEWKRRQSEPTLPAEDLHRFAQNFADTGDTSIFTNLGRGQQGAGNILAIRNEAYKIIEARGGKPADISMLNARFQGLKAAERAGATQEMKMGAAAYEAGLQANLATKLSEKLPRTRIVPFNRALQKYEENTSDPDMNAFAAASNTLVNSYVRAISPTGISTDLVRKHAYDMLNPALNDEAYKRVVDVLKQEMRLAVQSPKAFREHMEAEFRHDTDPSEPVPKDILAPTPLENKANNPNTIQYDKDGNRIKNGG